MLVFCICAIKGLTYMINYGLRSAVPVHEGLTIIFPILKGFDFVFAALGVVRGLMREREIETTYWNISLKVTPNKRRTFHYHIQMIIIFHGIMKVSNAAIYS